MLVDKYRAYIGCYDTVVFKQICTYIEGKYRPILCRSTNTADYDKGKTG